VSIANYTIVEGRKYAIPYTMTYDEDWIDESDIGNPIQRSETEKVHFYIKRRAEDVTARVELTDDVETEIEWVDENTGEILVHLNVNTSGFGGYNDYELAVEFPDGSFTTMDIGKIFIIQSVVDNPS